MRVGGMGDGTLTDVTNWVLAQGYWVWALGVAGVFYGTTRWLCDHLSAGARDTLALWLMGTAEDRWARQFCLLFDRAFGDRHFSLRCFVRSSIASILAVFALYLLFGPVFGFLEGRTVAGLSLWQALLIGAAVNILPDYLSLLETRWVLQRMDRVRSVFGQAAVLVLDLAFSAAIIWGGITLFRWAMGEAPLTWVEMLAFFSAFSIFFYSSFVTSVWSWLYCLTTWFLRLFTRTPLGRLLDVETDPAKQVALVGAGVVLLVGVGAAPMIAPGAAGEGAGATVGRFDDWLCRTFPDDACDHVVRLTPDEERRLAYIESICEGGTLEFCWNEALRQLGVGDAAAATLFRRGCDSGDVRGCTNLGWMYETGSGVEQDEGKAVALYRQGCDGGDALGCANLGVMYRDGRGVEQDDTAAVTLYRQGCDGGDALGCTNLGWMYVNGLAVEQDDGMAVALYRQGCDGGNASGCANLGDMYRQGRGVDQDDGAAVALYRQGCDGGNAVGCNNLGVMYRDGRGVDADAGAAVVYFRRGCELEFEDACARAQALEAAGD